METANPLGTEKVSKLLVKFSVPAVIGMVVNALYNIVDRIYIGNAPELGANGIGGITIGFPIMIILMSFGILLGTGGATLFSINLGKGKTEDAKDALGNAFSLLLISGFLIMVLGQIFLSPLLGLFGASETILPYATEYMRTIFFGAIFQVVSMGMNNFLRADGQPKLAMITMFMGAGVNIILDPIFIYGFKMGMRGAALATIISQCLSMIWILSYFLGKRANNNLQLKHMKLKPRVMLSITTLGLPGFLMQLSNSLLTAILNTSLMTYGGDLAISGMGIVNSVQTMLLMPIMGISQGVQPIISFNYGAQKYDRVKIAMKLAIVAGTVIVVVGWLLTRLFPDQIVSLFNRETELVQFGSKALMAWFWFLPVIGFQVLAANFFQAIGRSTSAMVLTLSRQVVVLLPAILIFSRLWGMGGLLYAAPFADALSALITGIWFWLGMKRLSDGKINTGDAIPTVKKKLKENVYD